MALDILHSVLLMDEYGYVPLFNSLNGFTMLERLEDDCELVKSRVMQILVVFEDFESLI